MWWPALAVLLVSTEQANTIEIEVLDRQTQQPVEGVELIVDRGRSPSAITNSEGQIVISVGAVPVALSLRRTGYAPRDTLLGIIQPGMTFFL